VGIDGSTTQRADPDPGEQDLLQPLAARAGELAIGTVGGRCARRRGPGWRGACCRWPPPGACARRRNSRQPAEWVKVRRRRGSRVFHCAPKLRADLLLSLRSADTKAVACCVHNMQRFSFRSPGCRRHLINRQRWRPMPRSVAVFATERNLENGPHACSMVTAFAALDVGRCRSAEARTSSAGHAGRDQRRLLGASHRGALVRSPGSVSAPPDLPPPLSSLARRRDAVQVLSVAGGRPGRVSRGGGAGRWGREPRRAASVRGADQSLPILEVAHRPPAAEPACRAGAGGERQWTGPPARRFGPRAQRGCADVETRRERISDVFEMTFANERSVSYGERWKNETTFIGG
jgi:hypothetical protein